jgi:S1-C subfamily serine protease
MAAPPLAQAAEAQAADERPEWAATLGQVADGVVAIKIDLARAFDTEWAASGQATGFVVDAQRGIILTNRHVVTPGPVTAGAVFVNHEEVELTPIYRDPVHDFGFYRYDPKKLRFMKPRELLLAPDEAKVGAEIRVVGNDAGEQLSILAGTLARLDREAPVYGAGKYNDFNTFYYQAASGTSGGSSGSPVVNVRGHAIALNAGGATQAASSFYLPLDRVVRALALVREGKPVPRGTIQAIFGYTPYDELRRLGLRNDTEAAARLAAPRQTGMLVVREVQPGSASESQLAPGDILVRVNGRLVTEFLTLESLLDDSVGMSLDIEVERGGETLKRTIPVDDLHALTPNEYITFGEAVMHRLSYQVARHMNVPVKGIYVANPGYVLGTAGVPKGAVITSFDGHPVVTLDDLEKVLNGLAQGDRATLRFFTADDTRSSQIRSVRIDRRWFNAARCQRNDVTGQWPCRTLNPGPSPTALQPMTTSFQSMGDERADRLAPSLAMVNFDAPFPVSGISGRSYHGTGVVVDAERGLLVTDRDTVPLGIGDVRLTFGGTVEIPASVVYVHPLHNLVLVAYDPHLLGGTSVRAAHFSTDSLHAGEDVWVVGLRSDQRLAAIQTRVSAVDAAQFPLSHSLEFRDTNIDLVSLVNPPSDFDGALVDRSGAVRALWSTFVIDGGRESQQVTYGIPTAAVAEMLDAYRAGRTLRSLEAELQPLPLAFARKLGLSDDWIRRLSAKGASRQVMGVARLVAGTSASRLLQSGDLILAIDGHPVGGYRDIEASSQKPIVHLTLLRNGHETQLDLETTPVSGTDVERILLWSGAALQAPHRAIAAQRGVAPEGVFVAYFNYGSPATRYGLWAGLRIVEVDGRPTPDIDAFLNAVKDCPAGGSLRLKVVAWNNQTEVITLKPDLAYWPTIDLRKGKDGWERREIE